MKKRLLSLLLALVFAVSLIPVALAAPKVETLTHDEIIPVDEYSEVVLNVDLSLFADGDEDLEVSSISADDVESLPPGMGISWTKDHMPMLKGKPTEAGYYEQTFTVKISNGGIAYYDLYLFVAKPVIETQRTLNLEVNMDYNSIPMDLGGMTGTIYQVNVVGGDPVPGSFVVWGNGTETVTFGGTINTPGTYKIDVQILYNDGWQILMHTTLNAIEPSGIPPKTFTLASDAVIPGKQYAEIVLDIDPSLYEGNKFMTTMVESGYLPVGMKLDLNSEGQPMVSGTPTSYAMDEADLVLRLANGSIIYYNLVVIVISEEETVNQTIHMDSNRDYDRLDLDLSGGIGDIYEVKLVGGDSVPGNLRIERDGEEKAYFSGTVYEAGTYNLEVQVTYKSGIMVLNKTTLIVEDRSEYHSITTENCSTNVGSAKEGDIVQVSFYDYFHKPTMDRVLDHWELTPSDLVIEWNEEVGSDTFIMPNEEVTIIAVQKAMLNVTVEGGEQNGGVPLSGNGVWIHADDPPAGQVFDHWVVISGDATVEEPNNPETILTLGKEDATVKAVFMTEGEKSNPFTDVSVSDPCYDAVLWAYYHDPQITDGMTDTTFGPKLTVTRGQCVTFLWRAMGKPEPSGGKNPFTDVPADQYYYKAVLWAVEKGITDGVTDNSFEPNTTLSTQHIITFLYRTLNPGEDGWSGEAAAWAGKDNGGKPFGIDIAVNNKTDCPRANVVQFLYAAVK